MTDIKLTLDLHYKWLRGVIGGERVDLRSANLPHYSIVPETGQFYAQ